MHLPQGEKPMSAEEPEEDCVAQLRRRNQEYLARLRRKEEAHDRFLTKLFGAEDSLDRQAPPPLQNMESQLGEHAAQLRNAARFLMGRLVYSGQEFENSARAAMAICNIARTNVMIARALREDAEKNRKTVDGVAVTAEPQD
jgi:hypothetical protein